MRLKRHMAETLCGGFFRLSPCFPCAIGSQIVAEPYLTEQDRPRAVPKRRSAANNGNGNNWPDAGIAVTLCYASDVNSFKHGRLRRIQRRISATADVLRGRT